MSSGHVRCAICKRTDANYTDSTARMWHSKRCAHSVCEGCRRSGFASRSTIIKCPQPCGVTLTKADFSDKTPAEREFEREKEVRRGLKGVFNLRREDFAGRGEEWHRYCERQEGLVMALVTGSEAERKEAERAVEEHRRAHAVEINRAAARRNAEETVAHQEERADISVRKAAAAAVADEAAKAARVAEEVKRFKLNLAWGDLGEAAAGAGGSEGAGAGAGAAAAAAASAAGGVAALQSVKERLLAIRAARAAAAAAKRAERPPPPPPPCPHIALPRVEGLRNRALAALPYWQLPGDTLQAHWRAAGWELHKARQGEEQELREMLDW